MTNEAAGADGAKRPPAYTLTSPMVRESAKTPHRHKRAGCATQQIGPPPAQPHDYPFRRNR